jgi:predicted acetyltransferase
VERVLLVCAAGNIASTKTIERCGGVLESATEPGAARWYRIKIARN